MFDQPDLREPALGPLPAGATCIVCWAKDEPLMIRAIWKGKEGWVCPRHLRD
jgi:hypothetical protein